MPTYNYECISCKNVILVIQRMNESAFEEYKCTTCKKEQKVRRIISGGSGMIFKGSGFYLTDYTEYGKKDKKIKETKTDSKPVKSEENKNKKKKKKKKKED
tara:strand:- start:798 stop:1100 length:303 start_codon:yes stop_codon:yes gene_type:complete